MSLCHQCGKPVYFAERRTSLGKEWHRTCLRCEECGKVLHPGQHAEHKGVPYCSVPCYGVLFGPTMYGHGSPVESHRSFGKPSLRSPKASPVKKSDLETKLKAYNIHQEGRAQIVSREVNGRIVLEGVLRVAWGVLCPIQLQPKDDSLPKSWRRSYHIAIDNGLDDDLQQLLNCGASDRRSKNGENGEDCHRRKSSLDDLFQAAVRDPDTSPPSSPVKGEGQQQEAKNVVMRRSRGRKRQSKRLSIFSGHEYNLETSVFTPSHGSTTNVHVSSLDAAQEVINMLLDKFKVVNNPEEFCLCVVRNSGETRVLKDDSYPLLERVILGPLEDEAKIFIMEKHRTQDVSMEVAQFVNLPEPVLKGFLQKLEKDEKEDLEDLKARYRQFRTVLQEELDRLQGAKVR